MKKQLLIVLGVAVLACAAWYQFGDRLRGTNGEFLQTDEGNPITTSTEAYYPGANGYYAHPTASGSYPGVVMIHENRGINSGIRMMAEELARRGYMVLAVDLFGRSVEQQEDAAGLTANFKQETGTANMRAAVKFLRDHGATKIASLGWCFGGRQSIELAVSGEKLDATVVYYGGNMKTAVEELRPITWPVLGIFGDADRAIPVEKVREFEASLNELGIENEVYLYPGVGHAFANPSGMNYAPEETKDAWSKTLSFLNRHLR